MLLFLGHNQTHAAGVGFVCFLGGFFGVGGGGRGRRGVCCCCCCFFVCLLKVVGECVRRLIMEEERRGDAAVSGWLNLPATRSVYLEDGSAQLHVLPH